MSMAVYELKKEVGWTNRTTNAFMITFSLDKNKKQTGPMLRRERHI